MLKFFFNRHSLMIRLVNGVGFLGMLLVFYCAWQESLRIGPATAFLIASWWILNFCNSFPWYSQRSGPDGRPEKLGIRLHFHKVMIPYLYILALAFLLKLLGAGEGGLAVFCVLFLPVYYVNAILLYFHFRDSSTLTPSYFSHNFYRKDEEPPCTP